MSEKNESTSTQRKGFVSPLQKAQAGIIGGGKSSSSETPTKETERKTKQSQPASDESAKPAEKSKVSEETHFRQTIWMPRPLKRRLKLHLAHTDENITSFIIRLIEQELARQEKD